MNTQKSLSIRELMPGGYLRELAAKTGCRQRSTLYGVVTYESTSSKYWPAVESLAKQTNPEGFAAWQTAQSQPAD